MQYAHSIECWKDNKLVGGLYGIQLVVYFLLNQCLVPYLTEVK